MTWPPPVWVMAAALALVRVSPVIGCSWSSPRVAAGMPVPADGVSRYLNAT